MFEGDIIDLGERKLEVVHVPGHTPGSITLLDREERCLIGGDPIQIDGEIYMFGLHRDMEAYVFGLEHLLERAGEFDGMIKLTLNPAAYATVPKYKPQTREIWDATARRAKSYLLGNIIYTQR